MLFAILSTDLSSFTNFYIAKRVLFAILSTHLFSFSNFYIANTVLFAILSTHLSSLIHSYIARIFLFAILRIHLSSFIHSYIARIFLFAILRIHFLGSFSLIFRGPILQNIQLAFLFMFQLLVFFFLRLHNPMWVTCTRGWGVSFLLGFSKLAPFATKARQPGFKKPIGPMVSSVKAEGREWRERFRKLPVGIWRKMVRLHSSACVNRDAWPAKSQGATCWTARSNGRA